MGTWLPLIVPAFFSVALSRFNGIYGSRAELIQAGAMMSLILPLILLAAAQRFFVQGIVITGVEK